MIQEEKSSSSPLNSMKKWGIYLGLCVTVLTGYGLSQLYSPVSKSQEIIYLDVEPNMTVRTLASHLKKKNLIKKEKTFLLYLRFTNLDKKIRAGRFKLSPSYSLLETVDYLTEKKGSQNFLKVTVPEGYSIHEIANLLESNNLIKAADFKNYVQTQAKQDLISTHSWLESVPTSNLEGYLYPDTYFFAKGTKTKTIVNSMISQTEKILLPLYKESKKKKNYNFHRMMTIASIIQKEAASTKEMPQIAAVFFNRLKKMQRLESCPTVLYAIGKPGKTELSYHDLDTVSPYNTYREFGLPPTPISYPGKQAFTAAIKPAKNPYLFFVSNKDGTHTFSSNYNDHLNAQRRIERNHKNKTNKAKQTTPIQ